MGLECLKSVSIDLKWLETTRHEQNIQDTGKWRTSNGRLPAVVVDAGVLDEHD
jgi:hypothetical protein